VTKDGWNRSIWLTGFVSFLARWWLIELKIGVYRPFGVDSPSLARLELSANPKLGIPLLLAEEVHQDKQKRHDRKDNNHVIFCW
jgi:hypothetical protein